MKSLKTRLGNKDEEALAEIRQLVYDRSGILLKESKVALVKARIAKRMHQLNLADYGEYLNLILTDNSGQELQSLLDAISTNTTSFYREKDHFDFIKSIVRDWINNGQRHFRLWSTASSTGEEPYTLAIEFQEALGNKAVDAKILATDINREVLQIAQKGYYPEDRVIPVPMALRHKYFTKTKDERGYHFQVRHNLRELILFRQFNLTTMPYPIRPDLDIILCRNVMIYFDRGLRIRLAVEFERLLKPGGYLLIGHTESLTGMSSRLSCVTPSIYRKE